MNNQYQFIYNSAFSNDSCDGQFPLQKQTATTVVFEDGQTWMAVLDEFLHFLSNVYGYDIAKEVNYRTFEDRLADHKINLEDDEDIWGDIGKEFN